LRGLRRNPALDADGKERRRRFLTGYLIESTFGLLKTGFPLDAFGFVLLRLPLLAVEFL
jgi:hypothetical protein